MLSRSVRRTGQFQFPSLCSRRFVARNGSSGMPQKKNSPQRWKRLSRERARKRLRREAQKRESRALKSGNIPNGLSQSPKLRAPEVFGLGEPGHRKEVLQFLNMLRELTLRRKKRVSIDFSKTRRMVSCGTLLFLAEARRIIGLRGSKAIACGRVLESKVGQVLKQIGFFDAIGRRSAISPTAEDVIHWRAIAGKGAEGEKANQLVESLREKLPPLLSTPMYDGLVEAMTNCAQHAYIRNRRDGLGIPGNGEWWMFAQEHEGKLMVVICDLGIGIPNSLPLTHGEGVVQQVLARLGRFTGLTHTDADLVGAAVEIGRSRTRQPHRGKGFRDVVDVIDSAGSGTLRIYSNGGCYTYEVENRKPSHQYRNYRGSIMGTLIQWSVPVQVSPA